MERTLEGTWEEISLRGNELVGRKVRVTILDAPSPEVSLDKALAHLIRSAEDLSGTFPKVDSSASANAWSDGVEEKYRRQGFTF